MKAAVRVICPPAVCGGFALAGLPALPARNPAEAARALRDLAGRPDTGVVLIDEALHDGLPAELHRGMARRPAPMVVTFPAPRWEAVGEGPEAYVVELLRHVIGYRVRLR